MTFKYMQKKFSRLYKIYTTQVRIQETTQLPLFVSFIEVSAVHLEMHFTAKMAPMETLLL